MGTLRSMGLARIVGGAAVTPFAHNWVSLLNATGYQCGASLLDGGWALTAAHCTAGAGGKLEPDRNPNPDPDPVLTLILTLTLAQP